MQLILLALCVTITILAISAIKSAKLRAAVYSLPIPITIILLGTSATINATHPFSLLLVIAFMAVVWLLHGKLGMRIIPAIALAVLAYIGMGLINNAVIHVPFFYMYGFMTLLWLVYVRFQPLGKHAPSAVAPAPMRTGDYVIRAGTVFSLTAVMVGLRSLILGASVTFPFNGIFTTYIMRDSLAYLINEVSRNFIGVVQFFAVLYVLEDSVDRPIAFICAWLLNILVLYLVIHKLPRRAAMN